MGKTDASLKRKKKERKKKGKKKENMMSKSKLKGSDHEMAVPCLWLFFQVNEGYPDFKGLNKNPHDFVCLSRL